MLPGVPIGVKDVIDTADMPTRYNSAIYADHQPRTDAACVALVRNADGVVLGKTVGAEVLVRWFDPRTGDTTRPQRRGNTGIARFAPPDEGAERDWLLVLEAINSDPVTPQ